MHAGRFPLVDKHHAAAFVNAHTGCKRRAAQAKRVVERVQMCRTHVDIATAIGLGSQMGADAFGIERGDLAVVIPGRQMFGLGMGMGQVSLAEGGVQHTGRKVTGYFVLVDQ